MDTLVYAAHGRMARVKIDAVDVQLLVGTDLNKMEGRAYLTPASARVLAAALVEAAKLVERKGK
jgi:hypothetical protein